MPERKVQIMQKQSAGNTACLIVSLNHIRWEVLLSSMIQSIHVLSL